MIAGNAPVAELVDAPDSKSGFRKEVLVRFRPGAPTSKIGIQSLGVLPCGLWHPKTGPLRRRDIHDARRLVVRF
jgi:hypothetical protein